MNQDVFNKYTKTFGVRFSKGQKHRFMNVLVDDMKDAGYEPTVMKGKKLLSRCENYFFGNLKNMKTVIVVPYDTPERKFWHNVLYFPLDGSKTVNKTLVATYAPIVIFYLLLFAGLWIGSSFVKDVVVSAMISFLMFLLVLLLLYLMVHGFANRKNVNRNSAAVYTAVMLAQSLTRDQKMRTAFLFTDKNKSMFLGAQTAEDDFQKAGKNPNLIVLDCIGVGSDTKIGFNPQNRKLAADIAKSYPDKKQLPETIKLDETMRLQSAMTYYRKAVVIASGNVDENGNLYVKGMSTGKDTTVDETRCEKVFEMLKNYLKEVN